jgi:hypothetical protein
MENTMFNENIERKEGVEVVEYIQSKHHKKLVDQYILSDAFCAISNGDTSLPVKYFPDIAFCKSNSKDPWDRWERDRCTDPWDRWERDRCTDTWESSAGEWERALQRARRLITLAERRKNNPYYCLKNNSY